MTKLAGTWDLESSENWDEYMKELGVGFIMRKAAVAIKPTLNILNDGTKWTLKLTSTLKSSETNCEEGVEFEETTLDGRKSMSLITREGADKIVHVQKDPSTGSLTSTIVREIIDDKLVQTLTAGSVTCKRVYTRTK